MAHARHAAGRFSELDALRQQFLARCETYAHYTLPKICLRSGYDQNNVELTHDFQAVGAQVTNHLANKIMLAMFAPSRPFFRADPDASVRAQLAELGKTEADIVDLLSQAEKDAVKLLDQKALRPKMYEVVKHLIVVGNVLLYLDAVNSRVIGLRKYVARRSANGTLVELLIADKVNFDELELDVQDAAQQWSGYSEDKEVTHYRWIKRARDGSYTMTQWVDTNQLPAAFNGKWPADSLPYRVLTWDLSDDAHYGTGLVEDYRADFAGLSTLSRSQVIGAVLASEFRWLVNPAGMTKAEDFEASENGAAIAGVDGDITIVQSGKAADLQVNMAMTTEYVNRIGRGFLYGPGQVRNAERVTAEEIRLIANELETALGGAYSRLAVDIQLPLAHWLMRELKLSLNGSGFSPTIVTGLDALSRLGDLEDLKAFIGDLAQLTNVPEDLRAKLRLDAIAKALGAGRRVKADGFLKSDEEIAQAQQAAQEAQTQAAAAQGAIDASVKVAGQPQGPPA